MSLGVAEHVVQRLLLGRVSRPLSDDGAELALKVDVLRELGKNNGSSRTDNGRGRLEKELGHQLVFA